MVDPGVGTKRRPILVKTENYYFIGPDNGVFSFIYDCENIVGVWHLDATHYFRKTVSRHVSRPRHLRPGGGAPREADVGRGHGDADPGLRPHPHPQAAGGRQADEGLRHPRRSLRQPDHQLRDGRARRAYAGAGIQELPARGGGQDGGAARAHLRRGAGRGVRRRRELRLPRGRRQPEVGAAGPQRPAGAGMPPPVRVSARHATAPGRREAADGRPYRDYQLRSGRRAAVAALDRHRRRAPRRGRRRRLHRPRARRLPDSSGGAWTWPARAG